MYLSVGTFTLDEAVTARDEFYSSHNTCFNIDLTSVAIDTNYVDFLFDIIRACAEKTFLFTFVFNNRHSSPFFPSATYERNGFSIGLQPTDTSIDCKTLQEWLEKLKVIWNEIYTLFEDNPNFLGIDSSSCPFFGNGSFVAFIKRLGISFQQSTTTDIYVQISRFLKESNPKPVGLCGLMFPCLEDDELAREYESGNFTIERNLFLSLHSGLGIDTYPIGIDEPLKRVLEILRLTQELSNKYHKALSVRFVSDGKAKIGEKTDFKNKFLKDVRIQKL